MAGVQEIKYNTQSPGCYCDLNHFEFRFPDSFLIPLVYTCDFLKTKNL